MKSSFLNLPVPDNEVPYYDDFSPSFLDLGEPLNSASDFKSIPSKSGVSYLYMSPSESFFDKALLLLDINDFFESPPIDFKTLFLDAFLALSEIFVLLTDCTREAFFCNLDAAEPCF